MRSTGLASCICNGRLAREAALLRPPSRELRGELTLNIPLWLLLLKYLYPSFTFSTFSSSYYTSSYSLDLSMYVAEAVMKLLPLTHARQKSFFTHFLECVTVSYWFS